LKPIQSEYGFLLLESVWALASLWGIVALLLGKRPAAGH
jgi:hypothetical protein